MSTFEAGELHLAYERRGSEGDPLVLIHDGWDDMRVWRRLAPMLEGSFQLLVYDRRGHGASRGPPRRAALANDVADLAGLLQHADYYPAHLVGHGVGGSVAFRLARDRPELVRSIVVHEPPFAVPPPADRPGRSPVPEPFHTGPAGTPRQALDNYLRESGGSGERWPGFEYAGPDAAEAAVRGWVEDSGDPEVTAFPQGGEGEVLVPVLTTVGSRSPPGAERVQLALEEQLRNAVARRLPDTGHWAPYTDPDLFAGVLGDFLLERNVPSN